MNKKNHSAENMPLDEEGKTLFLIRHAKSSWDSVTISDAERPLNDRGKHDAPMMAKRLNKQHILIDVFISSPAKRAHDTANFFLQEFDIKKKKLVVEHELYEASISNFYNVIAGIDNEHTSAAIFSHNPGITSLANEFTEIKLDNMPTCSVFAVKAGIKKWKDFERAEKKFLFFDYPKNAGKTS